MFIKLTRFDNRPIWLNAAFVVTVEPRKDGSGAVVVPIGDGLDYDVRETPEVVLKMLDGCPVPDVVPVPVSDCLTVTPADVSPEPDDAESRSADRPDTEKPREESPAETKPKKTSRATKRTSATKKTKAAKKPELELSDEDVVRLLKLSPKSAAKLNNTLAAQFKVTDVAATVAALEAKGVLSFDGNHVNWNVQ